LTNEQSSDSGRTQPFLSVYTDITAHVERFSTRLTPAEARWLGFLIDGFQARFKEWGGPKFKDCLDRLDHACGKGHRGNALRLLGHAYLHISLDLPPVIADSLSNPEVSIPPERAQDIFHEMNSLFRDSFARVSMDPSYFGWRGWLLRGMDYFRFTASLKGLAGPDRFAVWRNAAWVNGESLAAAKEQRSTKEAILRRSFDTKVDAVINGPRSPIVWLRNLDPPFTSSDSFDQPIHTRRIRRRVIGFTSSERPKDFLD
jgi:hypothetical protein